MSETVRTWRKSSYSGGNGSCVEVGAVTAMLVRDTKDRGGPALAFDVHDWTAFVSSVKSGQFDP